MEFMSAMAAMEVAPDARKAISRFRQFVRNFDRKRGKRCYMNRSYSGELSYDGAENDSAKLAET